MINITRLDYTIDSPQERKALVEKILEENPEPNEKFLEVLGDYLINSMEKEERKQRKILTDNRMTTINRRETSFEGLIDKFENGEDGLYNLISDNKQTIFRPKVMITKRDVEEIPDLRAVRDAIKRWEEKLQKIKMANVSSRDAYVCKTAIIELRKDQYVIKDSFRGTFRFKSITHSTKTPIELEEDFSVDKNGFLQTSGVCLADPKVCSAILCNYEACKSRCDGHLDADLYYLMFDFDRIYKRALADYPLYRRICEYKMSNLQNVEIRDLLQQEFGMTHSIEYISGLWRNKIPNMIASIASDDYLDWYYTNVEKGQYKKCSRCGKIKLVNNKFFSRNATSKDGFYSICKCCRNEKTRAMRAQQKGDK